MQHGAGASTRQKSTYQVARRLVAGASSYPACLSRRSEVASLSRTPLGHGKPFSMSGNPGMMKKDVISACARIDALACVWAEDAYNSATLPAWLPLQAALVDLKLRAAGARVCRRKPVALATGSASARRRLDDEMLVRASSCVRRYVEYIVRNAECRASSSWVLQHASWHGRNV